MLQLFRFVSNVVDVVFVIAVVDVVIVVVDVAIAVEEGLLVPVVRFADGKTLTQIGTEVRNYAVKAREKKLQPSDWEGNTFTISK